MSQFSPDQLARDLAHKSRERGACANDADRNMACDCRPDPVELAEAWAGRARMAKARLDGRRIVAFADERVRSIDDDGKVVEDVKRRYYIETDLDVILDDIDREALRRVGVTL